MNKIILLSTIPCVYAQSQYDTYFVTTWILTSLLFLFYVGLVSMVARQVPARQPRFPFFLIIVLAFMPPLFFVFLLYIAYIFTFLPVQIEEPETRKVRSRVIPKSRQEISVVVR